MSAGILPAAGGAEIGDTHILQSCQPRSFTKMLLPQWVLVPTSSVWLLYLPVPDCFQQDALVCGLCSPTTMPKR